MCIFTRVLLLARIPKFILALVLLTLSSFPQVAGTLSGEARYSRGGGLSLYASLQGFDVTGTGVDLDRYGDRRGYLVRGFKVKSAKDLTNLKIPVLTLINVRGYNHFAESCWN